MRVMLTAAVVAVGMAVLLIWRSPLVTRGVYRLVFLLSLAAFGTILFSSGFSTMIDLSRAFAPLGILLIILVGLTPFVLLLEAGIAGYRGFSSLMRYVSLALAVLGAVGLVASVVLPRLPRR